jgi:hypothetical protein
MKYRKLRIAWSVAWGVVAVLLCMLWVRSYTSFYYLSARTFSLATHRGILFIDEDFNVSAGYYAVVPLEYDILGNRILLFGVAGGIYGSHTRRIIVAPVAILAPYIANCHDAGCPGARSGRLAYSVRRVESFAFFATRAIAAPSYLTLARTVC